MARDPEEANGRSSRSILAASMAQIAHALMFLSRIPLPGSFARLVDAQSRLSEAAKWFALVGVLLGGILALFHLALGQILPVIIVSGLTLLLGLLITGALHEDGLSDCADGLGGGHAREKALTIMKDSRIGAFGGLALILTVGLRWAALASLPITLAAAFLVVSHSASRFAMLPAIAFGRYARTEGLGKGVSDGIPVTELLAVGAGVYAIALFLTGFIGAVCITLGIVFAYLFFRYLTHRLGGYTGDGLGAMQQIAEITILIAAVAFTFTGTIS